MKRLPLLCFATSLSLTAVAAEQQNRKRGPHPQMLIDQQVIRFQKQFDQCHRLTQPQILTSKRKNKKVGLTVSFTINPKGVVQDVLRLDSDFEPRRFDDCVLQLVAKFSFPENPQPTYVESYRIDFAVGKREK